MNADTSTTIRSELASATIDTIGATLMDFCVEGQSLLSAPAKVAPQFGYHGAVLAPWPNRLAHGRYTFAGHSHQLPINDSDFGHALHGLVFDRPWQVLERSRSAVMMTHTLDRLPGYPFRVMMTITYRLEGTRLRCDASWENHGTAPAPFGLGFHPYFRPGPSPIAEWSLTVPSSTFLATDPVTALPTGPREVEGTLFDFRTSRRLGNRAIQRGIQEGTPREQCADHADRPPGLDAIDHGIQRLSVDSGVLGSPLSRRVVPPWASDRTTNMSSERVGHRTRRAPSGSGRIGWSLMVSGRSTKQVRRLTQLEVSGMRRSPGSRCPTPACAPRCVQLRRLCPCRPKPRAKRHDRVKSPQLRTALPLQAPPGLPQVV